MIIDTARAIEITETDNGHWTAVTPDGGRIKLTRTQGGVVYAHSWRGGTEPHSAARLFLAARKKLKEWGGTCYINASDETEDFWRRAGAEQVAVVLKYTPK